MQLPVLEPIAATGARQVTRAGEELQDHDHCWNYKRLLVFCAFAANLRCGNLRFTPGVCSDDRAG